MKNRSALLFAALLLWAVPSFAAPSEDFKGKSEDLHFTVGGTAGLGIIDGSAAFTILGQAAAKIVERGFVPDIHDSVWIEVGVGPTFLTGLSALSFQTQLRWDFSMNEQWTFFALGGLGGFATLGQPVTRVELVPRFGVGAMLKFQRNFALRAELAHDLVGLGFMFSF
ncbi:MAG: hypothetical protein ACXWP5_15985 [Bdellovibrionota bacterium]